MRANCLTSTIIYLTQELWVRSLPPTAKPTVPPPLIKTFTLDPADQVIVDECLQIDWIVQGVVEKITLLAGTVTLVPDAPATGSYSDCPTAIGTRRYTLRAFGPDSSSQATRSILVVDESVQPTADFSGSPTSGEEPLEVSFTAKYTGIVTDFSWSFGDGSSSTKQNPTHTYTAAGDHTVSLKVTGPGGSHTATKTNYIHVSEPAPPVAAFSGSPTSGDKPLTVDLTDGSTGAITSYSWSFGDGGTSAERNPSHPYAAAGDYTVSLTVTGPGGSDTATKTNYISVSEPAPPVAAFTGSPTSGVKPLTVNFTDGSTGAITSYSWSFGDGGTSTAQNPGHTYAAAGDYSVSLTVTGPGGSDAATRTNYISVSEPPPPPPVAAFTGSPTSGGKPLAVDFTDGSTGAITSYSWSFGDGGSSAAQNPSHIYAAAGDYTVSLTVTGPGGSDTATKTSYIHVSEPAPAAAGAHGEAFLLVATREPATAALPQVQEQSLET